MDSYKRLELLLPKVMSPERYGLRKELKSLFKKKNGKTKQGVLEEKLIRLERKINNSIQRKEWRRKNIPEFSFDSNLPITSKKKEIIEAIKNNSIIIVSGETGSGKTTQLPKFCLAAGRGVNGIIGCTQPRRIAATSIANRIAEELGEDVGKSVAYRIRFDEKAGERPFIKIMTDGILLAETQSDPYLNAYDTIIVDEAHERSINIDFILGILKKLLLKRKDLKLIITSATIDTEKFSKAFNNAPVIEVSGKMFPVEVRYQGISAGDFQSSEGTDSSPEDYTERAAESAISLLREDLSGDILIFMPTEQDIRETCELLEKKNKYNLAIFPLYSRLPAGQQRQIFNPSSKRKIIVATNIAETSLTIPNISYVIDTGLARMSEYSPSSGIVSMPVKAISRSSADQRMGRCGRVREGLCVRLYEEKDYEGRDQFTKPEIFRTNLAEVILKMTALGLGDISVFPFIDKPKQQAITDGYNTLTELGAIQKDEYNIALTDRGRIMAALPVDPKLSRMLIEAGERKCLAEVLVIASMLSVQDPRERPIGKEDKADEMHDKFINHSSDFLTLLNIWNKIDDLYISNSSQSKIRKYCRENFLSYNRMKDIREIHAQLSAMLEENSPSGKAGITSKKTKIWRNFIKESDQLYAAIHKSILTGFISNIGNKKNNNIFAASKQREAMVFPGSGLFNKAKDWIVCAELVRTSQLFARTAANIKVEWLEELAGPQCEYSYRDPYWDRERGDVFVFEHVSLFGLEIVKNRRVEYGSKNPTDASKIFIRDALVEDTFTEIGLDSTAYSGNTAALFQLDREFEFLEHNVELIKKFQTIENRIRKKITISRDDLFMFYADHLNEAYNTNTLAVLIKKKKNDDFLKLRNEDLISSIPDYNKLDEYPEKIFICGTELDLHYRFNPGTKDDGITVKIPVSRLQSAEINSIEYAIPGFYKEKLTEIIKNLPKQYRRHFVPVTDAVESIIKEISNEFPLIGSLRKIINEKYNIEIPEHSLQGENLPEHLKLKISIIDRNGKEIKSGKDLNAIIKELFEEYSVRAFKEAKSKWERENIQSLNFGDIPQSVNIRNENGLQFYYYPGLSIENEKLHLRLFRNKDTAAASHKAGIAKLTVNELSAQLSIIKNELIIPDELKSAVILFGGLAYLKDMYYRRIIQDNFFKDIRSGQDFDSHLQTARSLILKCGTQVRPLLIDVLESYKSAADKLDILKSRNKGIKLNIAFLNKIKDELNALIPRDFLLAYDDDELYSLGKYSKALLIRAERGCVNLQKDMQKENEVNIYIQYLDHENSIVQKDASQEKKKALRSYFWLIEEYKISVFAPEIKPVIKISGKRLEQAMEEIKRMK